MGCLRRASPVLFTALFLVTALPALAQTTVTLSNDGPCTLNESTPGIFGAAEYHGKGSDYVVGQEKRYPLPAGSGPKTITLPAPKEPDGGYILNLAAVVFKGMRTMIEPDPESASMRRWDPGSNKECFRYKTSAPPPSAINVRYYTDTENFPGKLVDGGFEASVICRCEIQ